MRTTDILHLAVTEHVRCPKCETRPVELLTTDGRLRCRPCVTCSCGKHAAFITEGSEPTRLCPACCASE